MAANTHNPVGTFHPICLPGPQNVLPRTGNIGFCGGFGKYKHQRS